MPLPTKDQISTAIENPQNILDPHLAGFSAIDGIVGPESYSGGFCIVYPVTDNVKKYAFRLWHTEIDGIKERLKIISAYLSSVNIPYFVEFEYVDAALRVITGNGAQVIDGVRMQWVEGLNLVDYIDYIMIDANLSPLEQKHKLKTLADSFAKMVSVLHKHKISHGDLQHGNIIVLDTGDIRLVDYDSIYVPTFTDEEQVTAGLSTYQHPKRKGSGRLSLATDDYFSELIIYLSILCIAEDFSLWTPKGERDDHILLFSDNDYKDITNSQVYNKIYSNCNSRIKRLLSKLVEYLDSDDLDMFVPLESLLKSTYYDQPASVTLDDWDLDITSIKRSKIEIQKSVVQVQSIDNDSAIQRYKNN